MIINFLYDPCVCRARPTVGPLLASIILFLTEVYFDPSTLNTWKEILYKSKRAVEEASLVQIS